MMKRNKELDEAYTSFIDDLMLFIKETRQLTIEKSKSIDSLESKVNQLMMTPNLKLRTSGKKRSISVTDVKNEKWHDGDILFSEDPTHFLEEAKDMRRIRKLAHNANFLYCFALFEYYAANVVKLTYKFGGQAENSPKKRYIHRFKEVGKKSSENRDHRYTDLFDSPQKMIEFYDELPETMNLWTFMLGIDKKGLYKDHILRYTEARERRNLLIHRGTYVDERYKKTFIKAHSKPDKGKTAEKFLEDTFENFAIKEKNKKIDMTVLPKYFQEVFEMLMIMSSLLYIYSFNPSKEDIDSGSLFPDSLLHDLMCFSDDIGNFNSLFRLSSVIFEYKENCAKNDWKNVK